MSLPAPSAAPPFEALRTAVVVEYVLDDPGLTASYETDWTRRYSGRAGCVVRPADTEQVAAVLRACHGAAFPVVVPGGNTGLVGGAIPAGGEVLLSLTRLGALGTVDPAAAQVSAGAGVTLGALQKAVGHELAARFAEDPHQDLRTRCGRVLLRENPRPGHDRSSPARRVRSRPC